MRRIFRGIGRTFYLYGRLMGQDLKGRISFKADFIILLVSSAMIQLLGITFLWVIYQRIPEINGWGFNEISFMFAMVFLTEGFASLLFQGCWTFPLLVNMGELDRMLLRPVSPVLQILASRTGINGLSNITIGGALVAGSLLRGDIPWTLSRIVYSVILFVSALTIRVSINFAANASVFWTNSPNTSYGYMVNSFSDFAKYPLSIYSLPVQALVTVALPYAFISFFPACYVFEKEGFRFWAALSPLIALYCAIVAFVIFRRGLCRYESTGN